MTETNSTTLARSQVRGCHIKPGFSGADKVRSLAAQIFPLTRPYIDQLGRSIVLWAAPQCSLVASVSYPDGPCRFVSPVHIHNPLSSSDTPFDLYFHFLLAPEACQWDFVLEKNGHLTIWPKLKAAGWQDAIPQSYDNCDRVNRLFRGKSQEEACQWFYSNGFVARGEGRIELFHPDEPNASFVMDANDPNIPKNLRDGCRIRKLLLPRKESNNESGYTDRE